MVTKKMYRQISNVHGSSVLPVREFCLGCFSASGIDSECSTLSDLGKFYGKSISLQLKNANIYRRF